MTNSHNARRLAVLAAAALLVACQTPNAGVPTSPTGSASPMATASPAMASPMATTTPAMASPMPTTTPATTTPSAYFAADLTGAAETPAVTTPAGAGGAATATLSADGKTLTVKLWTTGLTGDLTGAHIHAGVAGEAGSVVKGLELGADKRSATGTWVMGEGEGMMTAAQLADLRAGRLYVNAHTEANPGGEVRGQLMATGWAFATALSGMEENPATNSPAMGVGWLTLSADKKSAMIKVYTSGLTGDATGAHVHRGAKGENGPVVKGLTLGSGNRWASGTWAAGTQDGDLTDAAIADLTAGRLYLNVHTARHPDGEIRGQLMLAP